MSATYEDVQRTLKSVYEAKLEVHEAHKRFETAKAVFRATSASWEGGALPNEPSVDDEPTFNPQDTFNQPPKNHRTRRKRKDIELHVLQYIRDNGPVQQSLVRNFCKVDYKFIREFVVAGLVLKNGNGRLELTPAGVVSVTPA
jgi:predicted transcriptional regulator